MSWDDVLVTGPRELADEALCEPGVALVELLDDARTRVVFLEKDRETLVAERSVEV